jgi:hypothetical protein
VFLAIIGVLLTGACNEIPPKIPEFVPPSGDRKVLIEEFSGVQCPNCPAGAAQVENLIALYGDRIVAVTMHSHLTGILSAPFQDSKYDFRTESADQIVSFLNLQGIPSATIDRVMFEGENELALSPTKWASKVEEALSKDAPVGIALNVQFDSLSRSLSAEVSVLAQENINGDIRIHMGLVESGLIDKQIDGSELLENYEHNHILRTYLTDPKGDNIKNTLEEREQWSKIYSFDLPAQEKGWWAAENMYVFAFVSNITSNSIAVLQAEEVALIND